MTIYECLAGYLYWEPLVWHKKDYICITTGFKWLITTKICSKSKLSKMLLVWYHFCLKPYDLVLYLSNNPRLRLVLHGSDLDASTDNLWIPQLKLYPYSFNFIPSLPQCTQLPICGGALPNSQAVSSSYIRPWKDDNQLWRCISGSESHQICHYTEYIG